MRHTDSKSQKERTHAYRAGHIVESDQKVLSAKLRLIFMIHTESDHTKTAPSWVFPESSLKIRTGGNCDLIVSLVSACCFPRLEFKISAPQRHGNEDIGTRSGKQPKSVIRKKIANIHHTY